MTDLLSLLKNTVAYKTFLNDRLNGCLSHAYLIVSADSDCLNDYLKIFAKTVACAECQPCGKCRACRSIEADSFADVLSYPKDKQNVLSGDVEDLISESYIKPLESDKKVFLINQAQTMNARAQNKLLKTLEEPPSNVIILMGATTVYPLLPTVISRVKRLDIPAFSDESIISVLQKECTDLQKLRLAVACGDGTVGRAKALYTGGTAKSVSELVLDILINMKSSKDVLHYSNKIAKVNDLAEFFSVLELTLADLLYLIQDRPELVKNKDGLEKLKQVEGFNTGSVLYALEKVTQANKRKTFNANPVMLAEWLAFSILEGKYKWQKL